MDSAVFRSLICQVQCQSLPDVRDRLVVGPSLRYDGKVDRFGDVPAFGSLLPLLGGYALHESAPPTFPYSTPLLPVAQLN